MSYEVSIVADSIGPNGARITTFALRYPRMIHAEFMTHRMFSRNASSTRAIPTAKLIEWIEKDPAMPVYWGKNQKGMQATEELSPENVERANAEWLSARDDAIEAAQYLMDLGVHKQIAGRILEPWAHINVVVTATSFDNFFALRCDRNAMPEIQALAVRMARAYRDSEPTRLEIGWWHLPFLSEAELAALCEARAKVDRDRTGDAHADLHVAETLCLKWSVARCARVSYLTFEGGEPDRAKDVALHDQLLANGHWSPFEHQAQARIADADRCSPSGNFVGWTQYRQTLPKGVHDRFDFATLDQFDGRDFIV